MRLAGKDSLGIVDIEEVRVQNCLDDACNHCDRVVELGHLEKVSVNPVGNV